ncbi:MAG TPA: hypothetical protein VN345_01415, partial [Blastocatellia bacterium]|nr:hypothetical protein [Blastocatellia bacterium]
MANDPIRVRGAKPSSVRIEENYSYEQWFSRNPKLVPAGAPSGKVEVVVPYDGYAYFTPWARAEVDSEIRRLSLTGNITAEIGRLMMSTYGRTDLQDTLALEVPVFGGGIGSLDDLCADRHVCCASHKYRPDIPDDNPIDVHLELLDEDILELSGADYFGSPKGRRIDDAVAQITEQVSFKRSLVLFIGVRLNLPADAVAAPVSATITRISLEWPTLTHFHTFHLFAGDLEPRAEGVVSYNPLSHSLECFNIPFRQGKVPGAAELRTYFSKPLFLLIDQPGELYAQDLLRATVEVEIRGLLLSGVKASIDGEPGAHTNESRTGDAEPRP